MTHWVCEGCGSDARFVCDGLRAIDAGYTGIEVDAGEAFVPVWATICRACGRITLTPYHPAEGPLVVEGAGQVVTRGSVVEACFAGALVVGGQRIRNEGGVWFAPDPAALGASEVPGAWLFEDWIDADTESALLQHVEAHGWDDTLKRPVQHHGYRYRYRGRTVKPEDRLGPLPPWLEPLCERLVDDVLFDRAPDQVIANAYAPGQGISAHIDSPAFGPTVASLSLGSDTTMRLALDEMTVDLRLPRRSLLVLKGPARHLWTHTIPARRTDPDPGGGPRIPRSHRVSLTFRTVRTRA